MNEPRKSVAPPATFKFRRAWLPPAFSHPLFVECCVRKYQRHLLLKRRFNWDKHPINHECLAVNQFTRPLTTYRLSLQVRLLEVPHQCVLEAHHARAGRSQRPRPGRLAPSRCILMTVALRWHPFPRAHTHCDDPATPQACLEFD